VSGIVPDGVEAVFITAADGTSTRADVHDNGYVFVLAPQRRPEQRYLVWSGSDGAPHVQPLPLVLSGRREVCGHGQALTLVTPHPWGAGCGSLAGGRVILVPPPAAKPRQRLSRSALQRRREAIRRARRRELMPCVPLSAPPAMVLPAAVPMPARRRDVVAPVLPVPPVRPAVPPGAGVPQPQPRPAVPAPARPPRPPEPKPVP
jgi:hypothetical protein